MKLFDRLSTFIEQLPKELENLSNAIRDAAKRQHGENQLTNRITAEIRFPREIVDAQTASQNEQIRIQRRIARWTALAFVSAAAYAGISFFQWRDAHKQMRLDQRAWVKFGVAEQDIHVIPGQSFSVKINRVNIGKTVARALTASTCLEKRWSNQPPSFKTSECVSNTVSSGVMYPNDPAPLTAEWLGEDRQPVIVSQTDVDDWNHRKIYFVTYGRIDYTDIFGTKHWTTFCTQMAAPDAQTRTRECIEKHNDVDTNDTR